MLSTTSWLERGEFNFPRRSACLTNLSLGYERLPKRLRIPSMRFNLYCKHSRKTRLVRRSCYVVFVLDRTHRCALSISRSCGSLPWLVTRGVHWHRFVGSRNRRLPGHHHEVVGTLNHRSPAFLKSRASKTPPQRVGIVACTLAANSALC